MPNSNDQVNQTNLKIYVWLQDIKSQNTVVRRKAILGITDIVTPSLLIDGYGQTKDLMMVAESPFAEAVISPLIDLLKDKATGDKDSILYILFDLSRYELVSKDFVPEEKLESYMSWARRLRNLVELGSDTFSHLVGSEEPGVAEMANDLIKLLASFH